VHRLYIIGSKPGILQKGSQIGNLCTRISEDFRAHTLATGSTPSELLNGRQIRTKIDTLPPSPAHTVQRKQTKAASKSQQLERQLPVIHVAFTYK